MTILPTLIQSVAQSPRRDGSQPGSVRTSSPEPVQAAPLPHPHDETSPSAATGVDGPEPSALLFDDDGPRIVWAPLAIIAVSFALWAGFWLSVKWAWEVFL